MVNNVQNLNKVYNGLINVHRNLFNISKSLDISDNSKRNLNLWVQQLGFLINSLKPVLKVSDSNINIKTASNIYDDLLNFANYLDEIGAYTTADVITNSVVKYAYAFIPKIKEEKKEELPPIQPMHEGSLSTRYCPDHHGVQGIRISERVYQCPIDGRVYNYETGYTNYKGQIVPGGSVAEQTPITSDFGGIPMRVYDSRSNILNNVNY